MSTFLYQCPRSYPSHCPVCGLQMHEWPLCDRDEVGRYAVGDAHATCNVCAHEVSLPGRVVVLDWSLARLCGQVGAKRHAEATARSKRDHHGLAQGYVRGQWLHVRGAMGEAAWDHLNGRPYEGWVNAYRSNSTRKYHVRCRAERNYELIVRKSDPEWHVFVLVTTHLVDDDGLDRLLEDDTLGYRRNYPVTVRGMIEAKAARQPKWERTHGDREPAWFVPMDALDPPPEGDPVVFAHPHDGDRMVVRREL